MHIFQHKGKGIRTFFSQPPFTFIPYKYLFIMFLEIYTAIKGVR